MATKEHSTREMCGVFDAFGIDEAPIEAGNIKQLMLPCSLLLFATAFSFE